MNSLRCQVTSLEHANEKAGHEFATSRSHSEDQLANLILTQTSMQQEKRELQEKLSILQAEAQSRSQDHEQVQRLTLQLADLAAHLDQRTSQIDALESQKQELEDQVIQLGTEVASAKTAAAEAQSSAPAISLEVCDHVCLR